MWSKIYYHTTKAVRGPITKFNQSDYFIAGPIFSKYRTGYCPKCVKLIAIHCNGLQIKASF